MEESWQMTNPGLPSWPELASVAVPPALTQLRTQMKRTLITLAGCGAWLMAAALMPAIATAGETATKTAEKTRAVTHRNEQYDVNKDGKLDEQEVVAMKADRAAKRQVRLLAKYDANKNGQLDPEEETKHQADLEKRRQQRAERKKAKEAEKTAGVASDDEEEDDAPDKP
jgi:hypothetical protein